MFGTISIVQDRALKTTFFDALMAKYSADDSGRPKGFYPRLDEVTVYAITVDRMSGKETSLPAVESRWPSVDRTKPPDVEAPGPNPNHHAATKPWRGAAARPARRVTAVRGGRRAWLGGLRGVNREHVQRDARWLRYVFRELH